MCLALGIGLMLVVAVAILLDVIETLGTAIMERFWK